MWLLDELRCPRRRQLVHSAPSRLACLSHSQVPEGVELRCELRISIHGRAIGRYSSRTPCLVSVFRRVTEPDRPEDIPPLILQL